VQRPVTWFAAGMSRRPRVPDPGGLRAFSDDKHRPGRLLEVEVFLPGGGSATVVAEVVRLDRLPDGSPARFEVWLQYAKAGPEELARLSEVLGHA